MAKILNRAQTEPYLRLNDHVEGPLPLNIIPKSLRICY